MGDYVFYSDLLLATTPMKTRSRDCHIAYCIYGATGEGVTAYYSVGGSEDHASSVFDQFAPEEFRNRAVVSKLDPTSSADVERLMRWIPQALLDRLDDGFKGGPEYFGYVHFNMS